MFVCNQYCFRIQTSWFCLNFSTSQNILETFLCWSLIASFAFQIHFLYQFSLQFFLDIFSSILANNKNLEGVTNYTARLSTITTDLFQV